MKSLAVIILSPQLSGKTRENRRAFSFKHDYVIVYAANKEKFETTRNPVNLTEEVLKRYKNPDNDPRGAWQSVSVNAQAQNANLTVTSI